jgi:hypothetical protein
MDPKLRKWLNWLRVIHDEVQHLLISQNIFWEVQNIIVTNPRLHQPSAFYSYLGNTYVSHAVMGVRRQLKADKQSISFVRLLEEIVDSPQILSREYYVGLYKGSAVEDLADQDFDKFSGTSHAHFCPHMVCNDLAQLKEVARRCEEFADKRVAHWDKRDLKVLPRFDDLDMCIEFLDKLYVKYHLMFHAQAMDSLMPTYQYDWKAVFREPWIGKGEDFESTQIEAYIPAR